MSWWALYIQYTFGEWEKEREQRNYGKRPNIFADKYDLFAGEGVLL
jgi:hypothetical protein